jgi:hypothetical protein
MTQKRFSMPHAGTGWHPYIDRCGHLRPVIVIAAATRA